MSTNQEQYLSTELGVIPEHLQQWNLNTFRSSQVWSQPSLPKREKLHTKIRFFCYCIALFCFILFCSRELYPVMFRVYSWLCTQGTLLMGLKGPFGVLKTKSELVSWKARAFSAALSSYPVIRFPFSLSHVLLFSHPFSLEGFRKIVSRTQTIRHNYCPGICQYWN